MQFSKIQKSVQTKFGKKDIIKERENNYHMILIDIFVLFAANSVRWLKVMVMKKLYLITKMCKFIKRNLRKKRKQESVVRGRSHNIETSIDNWLVITMRELNKFKLMSTL